MYVMYGIYVGRPMCMWGVPCVCMSCMVYMWGVPCVCMSCHVWYVCGASHVYVGRPTCMYVMYRIYVGRPMCMWGMSYFVCVGA